ncbi:MAG TPA: RagB/SusD family nutrient uptake outer membrane protein, partial [Longimicrobiales bacterium]
NAAYVGRARVRLFQGNTAGADADAKLVSPGFAFNATYSDANNRRYNRMYASNIKFAFYTVEPASRNITVEGVPDPRVPVASTTINGADRTLIWAQKKWNSLNDPIRIASYEEAQLIQAEAEYQANAGAAIAIVNALRDKWGIPHYSGATDAASVKQLIINERRAVLWGEGQRNYDYERFNLPFTYAPSGANFPAKGGTYGTTTCLPLPDIERLNNPNIGS